MTAREDCTREPAPVLLELIFCVTIDEFCIKSDECCIKMMNSVLQKDETCIIIAVLLCSCCAWTRLWIYQTWSTKHDAFLLNTIGPILQRMGFYAENDGLCAKTDGLTFPGELWFWYLACVFSGTAAVVGLPGAREDGCIGLWLEKKVQFWVTFWNLLKSFWDLFGNTFWVTFPARLARFLSLICSCFKLSGSDHSHW